MESDTVSEDMWRVAATIPLPLGTSSEEEEEEGRLHSADFAHADASQASPETPQQPPPLQVPIVPPPLLEEDMPLTMSSSEDDDADIDELARAWMQERHGEEEEEKEEAQGSVTPGHYTGDSESEGEAHTYDRSVPVTHTYLSAMSAQRTTLLDEVISGGNEDDNDREGDNESGSRSSSSGQESGDSMADDVENGRDEPERRGDAQLDAETILSQLGGSDTLLLPFLHLHGVILFPNATVPYREERVSRRSPLQRAMADIANIHPRRTRDLVAVFSHDHDNAARVGVVARVVATTVTEGSFSVILRGEVRCVVQNFYRRGNPHITGFRARVRTICDMESNVPLAARSLFLQPRRLHPQYFAEQAHVVPPLDDKGVLDDMEAQPHVVAATAATTSATPFICCVCGAGAGDACRIEHGHRQHRRRRFRAPARLSRSVTFRIFRSLDPLYLMDKARRLLPDRLNVDQETWNSLPTDVHEFSWWLARNIPCSFREQCDWIEANQVSLRLKSQFDSLSRLSLLSCHVCATELADCADIISMTQEGVCGTFVNAHGFVCDLITVRHCNFTALHGAAVVQDSWFPGYSWTIVTCSMCDCHVGWLFRAVDSGTRPRMFFGLKRSAVVRARRPPSSSASSAAAGGCIDNIGSEDNADVQGG